MSWRVLLNIVCGMSHSKSDVLCVRCDMFHSECSGVFHSKCESVCIG